MFKSPRAKCANIFEQEPRLEAEDSGLRTTYNVFTKRTQNPLGFIGDREKNEAKTDPKKPNL
jgi:hypothetical protein